MMRFNHDRLGLPAELPGTGAIARALIEAGAPVNGRPRDKETPLITAASCGDAEVAQVLIDAGADIEAVSAPDSGGVPGGTALEHAAVFSMTGVVDVLVAAGAKIHSLEQAAAAGDIAGCRCTPRRAAAGPPASGGCSPMAPTPTSATPRTTAPRWRRPRTVTAPDTARSKPSSGPSPRIPSPLAPEPRHPNPPGNSRRARSVSGAEKGSLSR